MLKRIIEEKWFTARGVVGFWPAQAVGDDIAVYADEDRSDEIARFHTLRQQIKKSNGKPNLALSDFIAEEGDDYIGSAVNMASRLCDIAGPHQVLMPTMGIDRLPEGIVTHAQHPLAGAVAGFLLLQHFRSRHRAGLG